MTEPPGGRKKKSRRAVPAADPRKTAADRIPSIDIGELVEMYKIALAGGDPPAVTPAEKKAKAAVLRDIAYAAEKGYQISFPGDI